MTSLFMGALLTNPVPADEKDVRNTATPVNNIKPAAEQDSMPDPQEFVNDPDPSLGLGPRQLGSEWIQGVPVDHTFRKGSVAGVTTSTAMINGQVSTSGTAAARESVGKVHTTLSYAVGIEPVGDLASDNAKFGETYFKRNDRDIQAGMGNYVKQPAGLDGQAATTGKVVSRQATGASVYDLFLKGRG